jgi:hypothetical protein
MSKCSRGGLHQPPLLLDSAQLGGQRFVAVNVMVGLPGKHHLLFTHLIS